ncbi:hypothetical protein ABVT39_019451 [Epinephelus coioides]
MFGFLSCSTELYFNLQSMQMETEDKNLTLRRIRRKALHQAAAMDEMDLPQMKKEVESLKYQLAFKREKSSKTVTDIQRASAAGVNVISYSWLLSFSLYFLPCMDKEGRRIDCGNKLPLESEKCLCLPTKFGKVDRGRRPRGPLPEPGADEEQPVGGEREVHPSLEENPSSCHDLQLQPR